MTYTDTDIAKALKCCAGKKRCHDCPFCVTSREPCYITLSREASSLLARRDAEIERLHSEVEEKTETIVFLKDQATGWSIDFCNLKAKLNTARAEAIKEFAERLKKDFKKSYFCNSKYVVVQINNLVKEMTEASNGKL